MIYRTLGSTDLKVSCMALGGNIFGYFTDQKETIELLEVALENGINFIDTADVYSQGKSEEFIGKVIGKDRSDWVIATKAGLESYGDPRGLGSRKSIFTRVDDSLRRLNTDYIDLYQMHHYDPETEIEETLDALNTLKQKEKILHFGSSNYTKEQLVESIKCAKSKGYEGFSTIQRHYNLYKRKIEEDLMPVCARENISILAYGVLGRGVLTSKYIDKQSNIANTRADVSNSVRADLTETLLGKNRELDEFLGRKHRTSLGDYSLCWPLRQAMVGAVILGVRNIEQLENNIASLLLLDIDIDHKEIDQVVGDLSKFDTIPLGDPGI